MEAPLLAAKMAELRSAKEGTDVQVRGPGGRPGRCWLRGSSLPPFHFVLEMTLPSEVGRVLSSLLRRVDGDLHGSPDRTRCSVGTAESLC